MTQIFSRGYISRSRKGRAREGEMNLFLALISAYSSVISRRLRIELKRRFPHPSKCWEKSKKWDMTTSRTKEREREREMGICAFARTFFASAQVTEKPREKSYFPRQGLSFQWKSEKCHDRWKSFICSVSQKRPVEMGAQNPSQTLDARERLSCHF